ncbi:MAG: hypothetical protein AABZ30_06320 [Myxococcota bacterium]
MRAVGTEARAPSWTGTTDGLASAYQLTQVAGAAFAVAPATAGTPTAEMMGWPMLVELPLTGATLGQRMAGDAELVASTIRGQLELAEGGRRRLEDVKRRLGDL